MTGGEVRVATRGSRLALAQAGLVATALRTLGRRPRFVIVETAGDRRAPDTAWGEGAFVAEIERAILEGRADVAVHSAKDVPTDVDERLAIAAYLPRADHRDALVSRKGDASVRTLPAGARVGTDSPRRSGFLLALRPDLRVEPLSGNVDTRLRRLDAGETDALVLAVAGLERLGRGDRIDEPLDPRLVPPAPGQGAIAVQVLAARGDLRELLAGIDDRATRLAVTAERAYLQATGGGCRSPIGAYARLDGDRLVLHAGVVEPDGRDRRWRTLAAPVHDTADATALGATLADELPREAHRGLPSRTPERATLGRALVARDARQASGLVAALGKRGIESSCVPAIEVVPVEHDGLRGAIAALPEAGWVLVTSANGASAVATVLEEAAPRDDLHWAAVGEATAEVLRTAGLKVRHVGTSSAVSLASELPVGEGDAVLLPRGDLADAALPALLRARGARVEEVIAYRTREAPEGSLEPLRCALDERPPDLLVLTSGSTARGLVALARRAERVAVLSAIPAVSIGAATTSEAARLGLRVAAQAERPTADHLAAAAAAILQESA